jgi:Tol biopolymer transport system component
VSRELAVLIGLAMIGLAVLPSPGPSRQPAQMRLARGDSQTVNIAFAFSPDGKTIATTDADGRVALRSPTLGRSRQRFLNYGGVARALAFSPDGRHLALGGFEPGITLCDLSSNYAERPMKMAIEATNALAFSPDGRTLAATSFLSNQIILWDMVASRERTRLSGHSSPVISLAFAPDGRSLASGDRSLQAAINVWDLATGGRRLRLAAPGPVAALAYSPDGAMLASASASERSVRIWDPAMGHMVRLIDGHAPAPNSVAFAPDGRFLATADRDGTVKLLSVETG